jgi:hypothetical protein
MNPDKPDYHIENFWLFFKKSMYNYYGEDNLRPINLWCEQLNNLQKEENYNEIENKIRNYISLYAIDLIRNLDRYHMGILIANIKRWNAISNNYNFEKTDSKYHNIIFLLIDIYQSLLKTNLDYTHIFKQVELFIIYQDFTLLIEFAVKYEKPSILNKLLAYCDITKVISEMYHIKLKKNLSGRKILKLIELRLIKL